MLLLYGLSFVLLQFVCVEGRKMKRRKRIAYEAAAADILCWIHLHLPLSLSLPLHPKTAMISPLATWLTKTTPLKRTSTYPLFRYYQGVSEVRPYKHVPILANE